MLKKYFILGSLCISTPCFSLCPANNPLCDISGYPIFINDGWFSPGSSGILTVTDPGAHHINKDTPYTIRCLISFKDFTSNKDKEIMQIVWSGQFDTDKITYIEGNSAETNSHNPQIILPYENDHVYFKHVIARSDYAGFGWNTFSHKSVYACVAFEEAPSQ